MGRLLTTSLILFIHLTLQAQCNLATVLLENGNREYIAGSAGQLMNATDSTQAFYQDDRFITDIGLARGLFLTANDEAGNIKFAGALYNRATNLDYESGILDPFWGTPYFENPCEHHSWIWKFTADEIISIQEKFEAGNLTLSDIPENILSYPAKDNPYYEDTYGKPLYFTVAPFYDHNEDGSYHPLDGDRPIVMEENPDFLPYQFSYTIFHDNRPHTFSLSNPLIIEVRQTNYILNNTGSIADNAVYTRLVIVNRSLARMNNFRIGIFNDTDLGDYQDDYIGCDTTLNMQYVYNHGRPGLAKDTIWPLTGIKYLNFNMSSYLLVNSHTTPHDPEGILENLYYPVLNGYYADYGYPTIGGSGTDNYSNERTKFMFHDTPDKEGWSMFDLPDSLYADQNSITAFNMEDTSLDTFFTYPHYLSPNVRLKFDYVDFVYYDPDLDSLEIFDALEDISYELKKHYLDEFRTYVSVSDNNIESIEENHFDIYPNPNDGRFHIRLNDASSGRLEVYNSLAKLEQTIAISEKNTSHELNLSGLPKGIYFLRFTDQSNRSSTKKIIIK